jgi:Flp pilus assembly pilin Flp
MDIIATRNSFGDLGRVKKGKIITDLTKTQAEKLLASGAYRSATDADHEAAKQDKNRREPSAKDRATSKLAASVDLSGVEAQLSELREAVGAGFDKLGAAIEAGFAASTKSGSEIAITITGAVEGVKGEVEARLDALNKEFASKVQEIVANASAGAGKK